MELVRETSRRSDGMGRQFGCKSQQHGPIGIGIPGRQTGTAHGVEPTLRIEDYDEACFLNGYWPGFFTEEWTRGKREEHDTCSDRKQILT